MTWLNYVNANCGTPAPAGRPDGLLGARFSDGLGNRRRDSRPLPVEHARRYTENCPAKARRLDCLISLAYSSSIMLLLLSNFLVHCSEAHKLRLSIKERSRISGRRTEKFKIYLQSKLGLLSNRFTLVPVQCLQMVCAASRAAFGLYFVAIPTERSVMK